MKDGVLTISVERAARLLGISRGLGYELARQGKFPVPIVRAGRRYLVPRKLLLALLGEEVTGDGR